MKYKVQWTLRGSSEVEADNALNAALAVSDCAYVEQGQTFEIIKSEPIKALRLHRIDSGAFEW